MYVLYVILLDVCWLCESLIVSIRISHNCLFFFFQAEDGIRDLVRSRGLGDVYKRQQYNTDFHFRKSTLQMFVLVLFCLNRKDLLELQRVCLLYTSDAADERSSVDLGGRRIIKKKNKVNNA